MTFCFDFNPWGKVCVFSRRQFFLYCGRLRKNFSVRISVYPNLNLGGKISLSFFSFVFFILSELSSTKTIPKWGRASFYADFAQGVKPDKTWFANPNRFLILHQITIDLKTYAFRAGPEVRNIHFSSNLNEILFVQILCFDCLLKQ